METPLVSAARESAIELMDAHLPEGYAYHSIDHTREVVQNVAHLAEQEGIDGSLLEALLIAAWFHDTGHVLRYDGHEAISAELAQHFLLPRQATPFRIELVKTLISATHLEHSPQTLGECLLRDADTLHLATPHFLDRSEALRQELNYLEGKERWTEDIMLLESIRFYHRHRFYTSYAQTHYGPLKEANLARLKDIAAQRGISQAAIEEAAQKSGSEEEKSSKKEKKKDKKEAKEVDRGVQTMFRNTLRSHIELSAIADNKANIMLSVNAIILSILVANLVPVLDQRTHLIAPTALLVAVCIASLVLAIMAVRPSVTSGRFSPKDIEQKTANLLFFGNFHNMQLSQFEWGLREMIQDKDFLYSAMIRDFYSLGQVLAKKYRFLRWCYTVFMVGILFSAIGFALAFIGHKPIP